MSGQVKASRYFEIAGDGDKTLNFKGNINPHKIFREWNFKELALDVTNQYTQYIDGTSAVALANGGITLTTAATDAKVCSYAFGGIHVLCAKNPVVEFKFQLDVITNVAINAVLTDARTYNSGFLPFLISGATVGDTCSNGAGFCRDTAQNSVYFYIVNTKLNTEGGTILTAAKAPFAVDTDIRLRIRLDSSGNAHYYYNGVHVGYKASAVTAATALVPYFGIRNRSASAHVATLRYVRLWEDV